MFTVSCENDCIEVHRVKFCTTVIPSVFVNGISQIEVGLELECQLELSFFSFLKRLFKLLIFFFLYFIYCRLFNGHLFGGDVDNQRIAH